MRLLFAFWSEVILAVFAVVSWPVRVIVRRAKRERWSDPR